MNEGPVGTPADGEGARPAIAERVRVAIASREGTSLDAHFGSAAMFLIYDVTREGHEPVRVLHTSGASSESGEHSQDRDARNASLVASLAGCQLVFALAVGPPVVAKLLAAGARPIRVSAPEPVEAALARVRDMLVGTPPPWLRKVLRAPAAST